MTERLLTAEQLAERWQVKPAHVYALTRRGEVPTVKLGRYYRYRLDQIEAFEVRAGETAVVPTRYVEQTR
jgi:excisionase family DNA binding protein